MKVLWMKPVVPYPPNQGTRRVTLQLLRSLAPHHRIRLFARGVDPADERRGRELEAVVPGLEVRVHPAPNRRSWAHRVGYRLFTRRPGAPPPVQAYTCLPPLLRAFAAEARSFRPDLVVAEYWYARPYLDAAGGVPGVLFAHDLEYAARSAARGQESGRGGRWGRAEEEAEKQALREASCIWFLTEGDRNRACTELGLLPDRSVVVPYGLPLDGEFAPRSGPWPTAPRVLLFGSYRADFNRDALGFTLERIWPRIRALRPDAILEVAGAGLDEGWQRRARQAGARVQGEVTDVRSLLLGATVVLVPLRFGGGLRIRLLEALALGCTVVGTPVGVLGMGPRPEHEVLVGETPEELAGQVARALEEPALRRRLGEAGRRWVERFHSLEAAAARQREILEAAGSGSERIEMERKETS